MYRTASQKITRNQKIISSYLEIKVKSREILSNLQTDILKSSHLHLRYTTYAEGLPEKYVLVSFYNQKVNEIYRTNFGFVKLYQTELLLVPAAVTRNIVFK